MPHPAGRVLAMLELLQAVAEHATRLAGYAQRGNRGPSYDD